MNSISALVMALATAVLATVGCSSSSSSPSAPAADADTADAGGDAQLSPDCKRLYACCVGPAAQSATFCTGLVGQNICSTWLQSYALAGIQCS